MKATLETLIGQALQAAYGITNASFVVEHPTDLMHGDYATNIALLLAKQLEQSPRDIAEKIAGALRDLHHQTIAAVNVAGPGFINIALAPAFFAELLTQAIAENWGRLDMHAGKKIVVEHSSPNLFKPFHVGHVMNNAIGESIVRLAKYSGATVTAVSYPADVGLGIGKAIWALLHDESQSDSEMAGENTSQSGIEKLESMETISAKLAYLGDCYVRGTRAYDEDELVQHEVRDITNQLYEKMPGPALAAYEVGRRINLEYFLDIVQRLGSQFDTFIYESEAGVAGAAIVREHTPGIFEESEGAIIYRGEQDGLHTRVFINADGNPTYEAKDIGLISLKFERFDPDTSIYVTDAQQASYFQVMFAAAEKINPVWKQRSTHITHGRMTFKGQKMSSRLGGIPTAQDILDVLIAEVVDRTKDRVDASGQSQHGNTEAVAIAALKFVILRAMAGKNINFDPDSSLSFEGDSGPYLQYTAVRAASVLAKAKAAGQVLAVQQGEKGASKVPNKVTGVERLIARFPDIVERSITEWAPHHIVGYLLELAQTFNSWYGNTKIIDESDDHTPHRLAITAAIANTITTGLWLLGITVPEKM